MITKGYPESQVIFHAGDRLEHISLITAGEVEATSCGHTFTLSQSDCIGLCDLKRTAHTYTYTAMSDVKLYHFPYGGINSLDALVQKAPDASYLMTTFMCRHISELIGHKARLKQETETAAALIHNLYAEHCRLFKKYAQTAKDSAKDVHIKKMISEITGGSYRDVIPQWLYDFYADINGLGADTRKAFFRGNLGIVSGFLHKGADDITEIYNACAEYYKHLKKLASLLFGNEGIDLFSVISALHIETATIEGADFAIDALMLSLTEELTELADLRAIHPNSYQERLEAYWDSLEDLRQAPDLWDAFDEGDDEAQPPSAPKVQSASEPLPATQVAPNIQDEEIENMPDDVASAPESVKEIPADTEDTSCVAAVPAVATAVAPAPPATTAATPNTSATPTAKEQELYPQLKNSLEQILRYSEADKELSDTFTQLVRDYAALSDKNSTEDDASDLRRSLARAYYAVYKLVFVHSIEDKAPPEVINMFLNFGYVDADLAGHENAVYLCDIAGTYKGDPENNIYTIREWLTSIYEGKCEPSLSEFDMDYTAYVRDLKNSKKIDAAEEKRMLADVKAKLYYEMDNAFPSVNRVTFGNPSKFCPVFSSHNVVRSLKDTLVEPAAISKFIKEIRSIDFSAYHRTTNYSNQKLGITNEPIHVEVLPNFILMPNVGLRGSMWQDVERRVRTTPARMFMPIFLENDLRTLVMRLTGEFRWEICRRIQGTRWNDVTDPSLTAYFCDYLQFYMNNRSISIQTMNEIRQEVSAARNNYKTVFLSNYVTWLQNESRGMARLNSVALGILMTFCPFTAEIRENLKTYMRFNEAFNKYNVRQQKRVLRLTNMIKKLRQAGKDVPQEITDEWMFWQK